VRGVVCICYKETECDHPDSVCQYEYNDLPEHDKAQGCSKDEIYPDNPVHLTSGISNNIQDGFVFTVFLWNVDTQEHSFGIRIITCIYELHYEQYEEVHKQEYDK